MRKSIEVLKLIKKNIVHYKDGVFGYKEFVNRYNNTKNKKIYLIGTATNGNLGDQAISYSQILFLSNIEESEIIEITIDEYWKSRKYLKKHISPKDIICIQGGGNMGIEYMAAEDSRRDLIKQFPNNKIVVFPQTIHYGDTKRGIKEEKKSSDIYSNHNDLHIFAREKYSYEIMKKLYYKNNVYLVPDIVLNYKMSLVEKERNGILLCLRDDCESILDKNYKDKIAEVLEKNNLEVRRTDTCINRMVDPNKRKFELDMKWNEIASTKLLITDRLHGMVFGALTGTPTIIFRNYNQKVNGVYEWIKNLQYLKFVNNIEELEIAIEELKDMKVDRYDPNSLNDKFLHLYKVFE